MIIWARISVIRIISSAEVPAGPILTIVIWTWLSKVNVDDDNAGGGGGSDDGNVDDGHVVDNDDDDDDDDAF